MSQGFVFLEGDAIVIRLTADAAAFAWQTGMWAEHRIGYPQESVPPVTDKALFLRAIYDELTREEENGETAVHRMLDKAFRRIHDYGCEGVDWEAEASTKGSTDAATGGAQS